MKTIQCNSHGGTIKNVLVDNDDFDSVSKYTWRVRFDSGKWYSYRSYRIPPRSLGKRKIIFMHRYISDCPIGMEIDHIDGDGLNNQKKNLRIVTHADNLRNSRRNNNTGERLISKTKDGFIVNYSKKIGGRFSRVFSQMEDAISFRNHVLKQYYNFKSNVAEYKRSKGV